MRQREGNLSGRLCYAGRPGQASRVTYTGPCVTPNPAALPVVLRRLPWTSVPAERDRAEEAWKIAPRGQSSRTSRLGREVLVAGVSCPHLASKHAEGVLQQDEGPSAPQGPSPSATAGSRDASAGQSPRDLR